MNDPEPIIYVDKKLKQLKLNEKVYDKIFRNAETKSLPVCVISIVGPCRTGKSFLMNFLIRYLRAPQSGELQEWIGDLDEEWLHIAELSEGGSGNSNEPLEGFTWSNNMKRDTLGIVIWPKPFIVTRSNGSRVVVLLMDTQGLPDDHTKQTVDRFFAISRVISSLQIYNQMNKITSNDLVTLSTFPEYGEIEFARTGFKIFQNLLLLIRDWPLPHQLNYGWEGGKHYLELKKNEPQSSFCSEWEKLENCYDQIRCFLMPSIGKEAITDDFFNGWVDGIKPQFKEQMDNLIGILSPDHLVIKTVDGREQKLSELGIYIRFLVSSLKDKQSVKISDLIVPRNETKAEIVARDCFLRYFDLIVIMMKESNSRIRKETLDTIPEYLIDLLAHKLRFVDESVKDKLVNELRDQLDEMRKEVELEGRVKYMPFLRSFIWNSIVKVD